MKGMWDSTVSALILAIIVLVVIFVLVLRLIPTISKGIDDMMTGIKRPICCTMLGCKPAIAQITQNPAGGIICTTFCFGVCG